MKLRIASALAALTAVASLAPAADLPPEPVDAFLSERCFQCHDDLSTKGDLDLTSQAFSLDDQKAFRTWVTVHDRVRDGEMPPEEEPRPKPAAKKAFLEDLGNRLRKADAADVAEKGRVHSRRLTREEYENTVHDLLGIDVPLKEELPEDPFEHGFNRVADAQPLSHFLLQRYLDAADIALEEAFGRVLEKEKPYQVDLGHPKLSRNRAHRNARNPEAREKDCVSWSTNQAYYGRMPKTRVPETGWYRITVKDVSAVNPPKGGVV